jgi:hypothetical protein
MRNGRQVGLEFDIVGGQEEGGLYASSEIANGTDAAPGSFRNAC